jgi:alkylation response protein AidB-like acyl-CoA dehydrogenase
MDLNLDDDQQALAQSARQFVERRFDLIERAKRDASNDRSSARELFAELGELGWAALPLPESAGGVGVTLVDLALVLEELGRRAVYTPLVPSTVLVALTLVALGEDGARSELVEGLAAGTTIGTASFVDGLPDDTPVTGSRAGDGWTLSGTQSLVPYAGDADVLLLVADLEGRGSSLVLLDLHAAGVSTTPHTLIGGDPRGRVVLDGVTVPAGAVLAADPAAVSAAVDAAIDRGAVMQGAHTVGAFEAALQLSVTWVKDREQFGRPIATFQGVSNRMADVRLAVDPARLLVWEAAWAIDNDKADAAERAAVAKSAVTTAGDVVILNTHQVHGAMGYSTEYPLHVFTRAIRAYQNAYGTNALQLERIATAIGL